MSMSADFDEGAQFMEEDADDLFSFSSSPPNQTPPIPQWGALMAEITNNQYAQPAPSESEPGRTLPLQYHLMPPSQEFSHVTPPPQSNITFPSVAYPEVPFWTGAPLPFHPHAYPQSMLPVEARQGVLAAQEEARPRARRSSKSKKSSGRTRDKNGMFVKKKTGASAGAQGSGDREETQLLRGKIQELEAALKQSNAESAYLREALRASAQELSVLRSQGLVQQGALAWQGQGQAQPVGAPHSNPFREKSPRMEQPDEAFRVSLNYAEIKNNLRPTGFTFEPPTSYPLGDYPL